MLIVVLLFLLNFFLFLPFFDLGLFGDDWLTIFRYIYYTDTPKHLGPYSTEYFNHFTYFLNSYGPQDTITGLLYKYFGEKSNIYFILSHLLRVSASLSLYFPANYITKNKIASWYAVFFFLFSSIGIETSGWVFNMPSYIFIIFLSFFIYFYLRSHYEKKIKYLLIGYLFFFLTFISNPIRAHGLIPFVVFVEILWLITEKKWKYAPFSIIKILGFILVFFTIYLLGFKESISGPLNQNTIGIGVKNIMALLSQNRFDFLFYPIATLGSMFIPELFVPAGWKISSYLDYIFKICLPIFLLFSITTFVFYYNIKNLDAKFLKISLAFAIIWTLVVFSVYKLNLSTFSNSNYVSMLLIGGYILILVISLITKSERFIKIGMYIALGWSLISFFYAWWVAPHTIFLTAQRYLVVSAFGISLILAIIISLGKKQKNVIQLFTFLLLLIGIHAISVRNYIGYQHETRSREIVWKIWSAMPYIPEVGKSEEAIVFYFEGDGTNESIVRDSITFGFPPHIALIYKITEENLIPYSTNNFEQVISAVTDGKSVQKANATPKPIPIERVYGFKLQGKYNLVDITGEIREKLRDLSTF